jgi:hypothetical protein
MDPQIIRSSIRNRSIAPLKPTFVVYTCPRVCVGVVDVALKDLIAGRSELTEAAIESIVKEYVRYDVDEKEVHLTAAGSGLPNKAKVLVYLVALQGWTYVSAEEVEASAMPAQIESALHIPGGSLRPTLKDLKDRHIISERGSGYYVRPAALTSVKNELVGEGRSATRSPRPGKRVRRASGENGSASVGGKPMSVPKTRTRRPRRPATANGVVDRKTGTGTRGDRRQRFDSWVTEGYFGEPRTLADVQRRFHKEALIIPQTSIPTLLLGAVRAESLTRDKQEVNGKIVWVYRAK